MYDIGFLHKIIMSYPKELLYIFPALQFFSKQTVTDLKNPQFNQLVEQIIENRHHLLSDIYRISWLTKHLTKDETLNIFLAFPKAEQLTQHYFWALIEHIPGAKDLDEEDLKPIILAYDNLIKLQEEQRTKDERESHGIFLFRDGIEDEIIKQKQEIRELRRKLCLSNLGDSVKIKELNAICQQYPILIPIKNSLQDKNTVQIKESIYQFFMDHINQIIITESPLDLEADKKQLANAFVKSIFLDDPSLYQTQANEFVISLVKKVGKELSQYSYISHAIHVESIHQMFSSFIGNIIGHADKIAETYQFIQYTGFGSQSDFFLFDVYSSFRNANNVSELKHILYGILKPFYPILHEYRLIGLFESNELRKIIRILIPLLIITAIFIAITAILAPLALPEMVFWVTLIPSLFMGLGVASLYCKVKDGLYQSIREYFYGGQYQLPEFQVNERMLDIFGQNAIIVREFYIDLLKKCQELEKYCYTRQEKGLLTNLEKQLLLENRKRLQLLLKEWHDIHENHQLTQEDVLKLATKQLEYVIDFKRAKLNKTVNANINKELTGWRSLGEKVVNTQSPIHETGQFLSKLTVFKQQKLQIDKEEQLYEPIISQPL